MKKYTETDEFMWLEHPVYFPHCHIILHVFVGGHMIMNAVRVSSEGPRLDSASALPSIQKGCSLWTLSCDFVPHNQ